MTRISTHGSNQMYLSRILEVQQRVHTSQVQVSTEKKSLVYSGIARETNRLINFENEISSAELFIKNNDMADTRVQTATTAVNSAFDAIKNFKKLLDQFSSGDIKNQGKIETLQKAAFDTMNEVKSYLSSTVDGQYLFSGARVNTPPIELPATSLKAFQGLYDGMAHTYPTNRESHLLDINLTSTQMGNLTLDYQGGFLRAATNGALADVPAGARITLGGTVGSNADYTVKGHVAMNDSGQALAETADAGPAFLTYNKGRSTLDNTATGALEFAFTPGGDMKVSSAVPNALSGLQAGAKFTVRGSTDNDLDGNGDWDGSYVVKESADGVLTITNDTDIGTAETIDASDLAFKYDSDADGIPETAAPHGLATGTQIPLTISGDTATLSLGVDMSAYYAVGSPITITGTDNHNGTYRVTNVDGVTGTIEFALNPDAVRVSQLIPQTGRDDVTLSWEGHTPLNAADYGTLSFSLTGANGETITAATPGAFTTGGVADPAAGDIIQMKSDSGVNDGFYKVVSNDGTNIVIESTILADDGAGANEVAVNATVKASSWYKGDTLEIQHRVDNGWSVDMGIFASDPGFEKALRGLGIIAQGVYGTAGGLENHAERVAQARYLIGDALESTSSNDGPLGPEDHNDIIGLQAQLGMLRKTLKDVNSKHQDYVGFLQTRVTDIVHVDKTEAVTRLLDDQAALEAGYQALAKVRGQTLLDFLR